LVLLGCAVRGTVDKQSQQRGGTDVKGWGGPIVQTKQPWPR
jgi:hypothetical protein